MIWIYLIGIPLTYFYGRHVMQLINGSYTQADRATNIMFSFGSWVAFLCHGVAHFLWFIYDKCENKKANW